jgi:salicylate hydroxylase
VSITDRSKENTRWPLPSWSRIIDKDTCQRKIHRRFTDWDEEAVEIIDVCETYGSAHYLTQAFQTIDTSIEWAMMDLEPLPFYVRGRVALIGDAVSAQNKGTGTRISLTQIRLMLHCHTLGQTRHLRLK